MTIEPTPKDRMVDKLLGIGGWAERLRRLLTTGQEMPSEETLRRICGEIQYRFDELRELVGNGLPR